MINKHESHITALLTTRWRWRCSAVQYGAVQCRNSANAQCITVLHQQHLCPCWGSAVWEWSTATAVTKRKLHISLFTYNIQQIMRKTVSVVSGKRKKIRITNLRVCSQWTLEKN